IWRCLLSCIRILSISVSGYSAASSGVMAWVIWPLISLRLDVLRQCLEFRFLFRFRSRHHVTYIDFRFFHKCGGLEIICVGIQYDCRQLSIEALAECIPRTEFRCGDGAGCAGSECTGFRKSNMLWRVLD